MKIITWNCNGAFRKKFESLLFFKPDICVIQECENPLETKDKNYKEWANNHLWIGDSKNKGLGVFAQPHIKLNKLDWTNAYKDHSVKYFLPCNINNSMDLLAVWTHQNNSPTFGYIGQFWKYLQVNKKHLNNTLILGDLNSNAIWNLWDRWWNHSDVIRELKEKEIESFYHKVTGEEQGKESAPTLYFQKKAEKPYHIDYIFGTKKFSDNITHFEIGQIDKWLKFSDHMPIFCEIYDDEKVE